MPRTAAVTTLAPRARPVAVETVKVTPVMAADWLEFNTHNRTLRFRVVDAYAADMAAGDWQWNGETVKFAADGTLLDGQHRLAAIVQSGVTVPLLVVRDLESGAQDTVDAGARRQFSDALKLRGEADFMVLASVIRRIAIWESGERVSKIYTPTTTQMLQILEKHPALRDVARNASETARHCGFPASLVGLGMHLFGAIDAEDAGHFFERLADGQNMARGNPIYELRKAGENSKSVRGARSQVFLTAIFIKAWNAYREGRTVGLLTYKPGGANPERFPEPV